MGARPVPLQQTRFRSRSNAGVLAPAGLPVPLDVCGLSPPLQSGGVRSQSGRPPAGAREGNRARLFAGKLVNVPLEQLPLLFKAVLHSCKSSLTSYRSSLSPCVTTSSGN